MTNDFFAPVDSVTKADRDGAEQRLREAHQLGRIDTNEFEARMSMVITADRVDELAAAVDGPLVNHSYQQPYTATPPRSYVEPTFAATLQPARQGIADRGTGVALIAHLSPFLLWLFGPAIIWAISAKGSYSRKEAAKAFNWQLLAFGVGMLTWTTGWLVPGDGNPVAGVWTAIWVVLTIVGAVKAAKGDDWNNPIRRAIPLEVLSERGR